MKKIKTKLRIVFALTAIIFLVCACSNDEITKSTEEFSKPNYPDGTYIYCYISGKTVFYDQVTNESTTKVIPGSTTTFIYNSAFTLPLKSIKWSVVSAEPSGSMTINGNDSDSNISISFASNFEKGTLNVIGENEKTELCGPTLVITKQ